MRKLWGARGFEQHFGRFMPWGSLIRAPLKGFGVDKAGLELIMIRTIWLFL